MNNIEQFFIYMRITCISILTNYPYLLPIFQLVCFFPYWFYTLYIPFSMLIFINVISWFVMCILFLFLFFYCSGFCHTFKWISHGLICVPHPDPPSVMCILIFHGDLQPVDFLKVKANCSVMSKSLQSHRLYMPGSFVHGILQARILEWVTISSSRVSFQPRDWTWVSCTAGRLFTNWATGEATDWLLRKTVM